MGFLSKLQKFNVREESQERGISALFLIHQGLVKQLIKENIKLAFSIAKNELISLA